MLLRVNKGSAFVQYEQVLYLPNRVTWKFLESVPNELLATHVYLAVSFSLEITLLIPLVKIMLSLNNFTRIGGAPVAVNDNKCSFTVSTTGSSGVIIGLPAINGFKGMNKPL